MTSPAFAPPVQPDVDTALSFFTTLFKDGGTLHFRAVAEPKDGRTSTNHHYALGPDFRQTLAEFLAYCHVDGRAAYVLPGPVRPGGTGKADVLSLPAVLADFDKGDPSASLAAAEELLGRATVVVESGGATETGPKLHAYWRLAQPAAGAFVEEACRVRLALAEKFGGDTAFKQPAQVIRIPGSVHFKGTPKLVKLRAVHPSAVYELAALSRAMGVASSAPAADNFFDLRNVVPPRESLVERVLAGAPIRAEGKDDVTRYDGAGSAIGHHLRLMRDPATMWTEERAWEATRDWNATQLSPPWPEDRLRHDFERLLRIDRENHGPIVAPAPSFLPASGVDWDLSDWDGGRFAGPVPKRKWLIENVMPMDKVGTVVADGGAGKTMLMLDLAIKIACAPAPVWSAVLERWIGSTFFEQPILERGSVAIFTAEEDIPDLQMRLNALAPDQCWAQEGARQRFYLVSTVELETDVAYLVTENGRQLELTPFFHAVEKKLSALKGLKLVVFDPLSLFINGDLLDNKLASFTMRALRNLAKRLGVTIVLTHHTKKGGKGTGNLADAGLGAGMWKNNGRFQLSIEEIAEDEAKKVLKILGKGHERADRRVYRARDTKENNGGYLGERTLVRNLSTGLLEDMTGNIAAAKREQQPLEDQVFNALKAWRIKGEELFFPASGKHILPKWAPALLDAKIKLSQNQAQEIFDKLHADKRIKESIPVKGNVRYELALG